MKAQWLGVQKILYTRGNIAELLPEDCILHRIVKFDDEEINEEDALKVSKIKNVLSFSPIYEISIKYAPDSRVTHIMYVNHFNPKMRSRCGLHISVVKHVNNQKPEILLDAHTTDFLKEGKIPVECVKEGYLLVKKISRLWDKYKCLNDPNHIENWT